jgi:hypothetical protein
MASEKPVPKPIVGPILHFRGEGNDRWRLSALFVFEGATEPDDLIVEGIGLPIPPRHVFVWRGRHIWRFVFSLPRGQHDQRISYGFPQRNAKWAVTVPGQFVSLRLAYTSSNGIHDADQVASLPNGADGMWAPLLRQHTERPYHLLLQGGDQLHADNLWRECAALAEWWRHPAPSRYAQPFTRAMADQAMDYFFDAYCATLAQPAYARAMASIPSVMMWDDHDIFDGWGSRPDPEHQCQVYRGLFAVARRQFSLFQLGAGIRDPLEQVWGAETATFSQGFRVGDLGILALDLRSERSRSGILGEATWKELPNWLTRFAGCKNLLIMSCVPLAFVGVGGIESFVSRLRPGSHADDDLRDQWRSPSHRDEWLRLLHLLADFSLRYRCRITTLSGEVHLGAAASIHGQGVELWQLIASGVAHPPLGSLATCGLRWLARDSERISDEFTLELPRFAETRRRFIRARNFLSLGFDRQNHVLARWHSERSPDQYNLII